MTAPPFLVAPTLEVPGVSHGFFSRIGGVSTGVYASLNTGPGSDDDQAAITENRSRCADVLSVAPGGLLTNYQIHSAEVVTVNGPWKDGPPQADGLVTKTPGLALGVLAADCMPWLFLDPEARIVGAAHAGWRGALAGVLENTVAAMEALGATAGHIRAAVGPCLRQPNFEVGLDLFEAFTEQFSASEKFFAPGASEEKRQLDLAGFGAWRLSEAGVIMIEDLGTCTLAEPDRYFSYRNTTRHGEPDYGRNLSAIALL